MRTALLAIVICLLPGMAFAALYSCRDSEGRLHVTDNLQALPEECRADARQLDAGDPDNLHFVPDRSPTPSVNPRFQQQVLEEERRQQLQQAEAERMIREAEQLLATYQQAQIDRRNALRRWSYESRQVIQQATQQVAEVHAEKERLLEELQRQRLPDETSERIRRTLDQIVDL